MYQRDLLAGWFVVAAFVVVGAVAGVDFAYLVGGVTGAVLWTWWVLKEESDG